MVVVIILNGLGGSGKSTFAHYCIDYINQKFPAVGIRELSTVDIVKVAAKAVGWDGGKTPEDRIFLSQLKFCMEQWKNLPIKSVFDNMQKLQKEEPHAHWIFFVNSREQVDHKKIIEKAESLGYKWAKLLVENSRTPITEVPELITDIQTEKYDYRIANEGSLQDLELKAQEHCNAILWSMMLASGQPIDEDI